MRVLPGRTRCSVAAVFAFVIVPALGNAFADESAGRSPFGVLKREGFIGIVPPGTLEHDALFSRPAEPTTDAWDTAAPSSTPADDVVFAAPVLQRGQEIVTSPTNRLLPPLRPEEPTIDVFGAAPPTRPTADVVFAATVFLTGQESVTGSPQTTPPTVRPEDANADPSAAAQAAMPAADVVFAEPVLSAGQATVTGWTNTPPPPSRSDEAMTPAGNGAAQSSTPADDVVFARPALPAGQEPVTGPTSTLLPSPLLAATAEAIVFGPPTGGADSGSISPRPASPMPAPDPRSGATSLPALAPEDAARLKARARGLLANGSLAPARALLEQAASRGDAEGEFLLAETYDPEALTRSGMIGVAGDAVKADALYRAAQLGGYRRPDKNARAAQP